VLVKLINVFFFFLYIFSIVLLTMTCCIVSTVTVNKITRIYVVDLPVLLSKGLIFVTRDCSGRHYSSRTTCVCHSVIL